MKTCASLLAAVTWLGFAAAGCGGGGGPKKLQLGAILSTTGDLANVGLEQLQAANLAVEQINAAGGVLGQDLEIVNKDDGTDETQAGEAATEHVAANVPVVFGATGSALSLAAFGVIQGKGIAQIAASATSPALSTEPDDGYLLRTCPSDAFQGKLLAQRAAAHPTAAIIHLPDAYGTGLAEAFTNAFGGTVTITREYVEGESSYATLISDVMATNPSAIVLVAYPVDGAQILTNFRQAYPSATTAWYFPDGLQDNGFISAASSIDFSTLTHEGTGASTPSGQDYEAFRDAFTTRYGTGPTAGTFAPNMYDAVYLVALSMEAGKAATGAAVKDNITAVSSGGTAYGAADFSAAVTAAKAGEDIDYRGASGAVDLDTFGDTPAPYAIWDVQGGAIHIKEAAVNP